MELKTTGMPFSNFESKPVQEKTFVYQIYYSDETERMIDPGFIPLDNRTNERPDWREYWPIRYVLLNAELRSDCYYGVFSPRFREKTGLAAADVYRLIEASPTDCDVIHFSPFADAMAFHKSVFEQGDIAHAGLSKVTDLFLTAIGRPASTLSIISHLHNTIFCNYFVAKPAFWREWFDVCERLFEIAEHHDSELAKQLRSDTDYQSKGVAMKVFVMERMASYLLSVDQRWRAHFACPFSLPARDPSWDLVTPYLAALDALKICCAETKNEAYWRVYLDMRRFVLSRCTFTSL